MLRTKAHHQLDMCHGSLADHVAASVQRRRRHRGGAVRRSGVSGRRGLHHLPHQPAHRPVCGPVRGRQRGGGPKPGGPAAQDRQPGRPYRHLPGPGERRVPGRLRLHHGPSAAGVDVLPGGRHRPVHHLSAHLLPGHARHPGLQLRRGHSPGPGGHQAPPLLPHCGRHRQCDPEPVHGAGAPHGRGRRGLGHHHLPVHLRRPPA